MTHFADPPGAAADPGVPPPGKRGFSEVLRDLAASDVERVSVGSILHAFGDRAFGALLLVFALPNALPMPPGTSAILGAPIVFIAFQLMIGRPTLWLPRFITERSLARADFATLANKIDPWVHKLERLLKPRLPLLTTPFADRLTGLACFVLSLILALPIPFGNMPPAIALTAFALGMIESDGAAIAAGWLGTIASFVILGLFAGVVSAGLQYFGGPLLRLFGM
ncbi:exopolysaccharide biosynthesis protein [Chelatococcus sambhunathii]|uniref:Exopolysaccharide biosynthesis protein n=1 Tax=Chelatococcus sambhunathii TaxID=363953 RepID=A0ABU1DEV3_9HYPH|nr:exopolysaccharide biosynthesis protein [Chelatococcus sambhunathii]MDR4306622.1 exopolysaccharide biosynthesis protein [Chelatococcus sambhunathii]